MMARQIKCPCGRERTIIDHSNVGNTKKESGFYPIINDDGHILWMCPSCFKELIPPALRIMELTGDNQYLNFYSLRIQISHFQKETKQ